MVRVLNLVVLNLVLLIHVNGARAERARPHAGLTGPRPDLTTTGRNPLSGVSSIVHRGVLDGTEVAMPDGTEVMPHPLEHTAPMRYDGTLGNVGRSATHCGPLHVEVFTHGFGLTLTTAAVVAGELAAAADATVATELCPWQEAVFRAAAELWPQGERHNWTGPTAAADLCQGRQRWAQPCDTGGAARTGVARSGAPQSPPSSR